MAKPRPPTPPLPRVTAVTHLAYMPESAGCCILPEECPTQGSGTQVGHAYETPGMHRKEIEA